MSLSVVWQPAAENGLQRSVSSWRESEEIVKAVNRFAEHAEGVVRVGDHLGDYRLLVGRFSVRFTIDLATNTLFVWDVFRRP